MSHLILLQCFNWNKWVFRTIVWGVHSWQLEMQALKLQWSGFSPLWTIQVLVYANLIHAQVYFYQFIFAFISIIIIVTHFIGLDLPIPQSTTAVTSSPPMNQENVENLAGMGFPRAHVIRALNESVGMSSFTQLQSTVGKWRGQSSGLAFQQPKPRKRLNSCCP